MKYRQNLHALFYYEEYFLFSYIFHNDVFLVPFF